MKFSRTFWQNMRDVAVMSLKDGKAWNFFLLKKIGLYHVVNRIFSLPYKEKYSLVYQRISYHYLSFLLIV